MTIWAALGWTILGLSLPLVFGCFAGILIGISMRFAHADFKKSVLEENILAFMGLEAVGFVALAAVVPIKLRGQSRRILAIRIPAGKHLFFVVLMILPLAVLTEKFADTLENLLPSLGSTAQAGYFTSFDKANDAIAQLPWGFMLLFGAVFPGICEELFFRGFIGRGLVARHGAVGGCLLTSLLFGLFHIDPVQGCNACLIGLLFHAVFLASKSIWAPMMLHALHNALVFTRMKVNFAEDINTALVDVQPALLGAAALAIFLLLIMFYLSRVRWILPDGAVWSPGYVSSEMPPRDLQCTPSSRPLSTLVKLAGAGGYLAFSVALVSTVYGSILGQIASAHAVEGRAFLDKADYDLAIAKYAEAIRVDPTKAVFYSERGDCYRCKDQIPLAIADFDHAIALNPELAHAYVNRGECYRLQRKFERARADVDRGIQLDARFAFAYSIRGDIDKDEEKYDDAIKDWRLALELDPKHWWTHRAIAWLLATCPEGHYRDGSEAVKRATEACRLTDWKNAYCLMTLGTAYARCAQFQDAIHSQTEALRFSDEPLKEFGNRLLDLYREEMPYEESSDD